MTVTARTLHAVHRASSAVRTPHRFHVPALSWTVLDRLRATGWLESVWVGVGLAAACAVVVALVVRSRRRRHGRGRVLAGGALAVVLALLAGAAFLNTYVGYVPDLQAADRLLGDVAPSAVGVSLPAATGQGRVVRYDLPDPADGIGASPLWVYTPPGYDTPGSSTRYPVVYLLHGYPGSAAGWFAAGQADATEALLVAHHEMPPAILVAPDMNGGTDYTDTEGMNLPGGPQTETYLTRTVVGWVDSHFRTLADPQHRVIGGMSAGGSVALDLGLRHQGVFGAILAEEPFGDPGANTLAELHGNRAEFDAHSPDRYLPHLVVSRAQPVFLSVGGSSPQTTVRRLQRMLAARGLTTDLQVEPGLGHTWHEARVGLAYGLVWTAAQLGWDVTGGGPRLLAAG